jgi:hypothetical protein
MPYRITQLPNKFYVVKNSVTGTVRSKQTTREKALAQVRLLMAKEKALGK